jgi:hopanoid C-2 methylase
MRSPVQVRQRRRILCVFPRYAPSLATFHHAYALMDGVRALMPPQGILVIAAYLPETWQMHVVDENVRPTSPRELAWADAVFVSGMHIQRDEIGGIARRPRPRQDYGIGRFVGFGLTGRVP